MAGEAGVEGPAVADSVAEAAVVSGALAAVGASVAGAADRAGDRFASPASRIKGSEPLKLADQGL